MMIPDSLQVIPSQIRQFLSEEIALFTRAMAASGKVGIEIEFTELLSVRCSVVMDQDRTIIRIPEGIVIRLFIFCEIFSRLRDLQTPRMIYLTMHTTARYPSDYENDFSGLIEKIRQAFANTEPEVKALIGSFNEPYELSSLKFWCEKYGVNHSSSNRQDYLHREGFRCGLLFLILHEASHIHAKHIEIARLAIGELGDVEFVRMRRAMEIEADALAIKGLLSFLLDRILGYSDHFKFAPNSIMMSTMISAQFRAAFYGVSLALSLLSCHKLVDVTDENSFYYLPSERFLYIAKCAQRYMDACGLGSGSILAASDCVQAIKNESWWMRRNFIYSSVSSELEVDYDSEPAVSLAMEAALYLQSDYSSFGMENARRQIAGALFPVAVSATELGNVPVARMQSMRHDVSLDLNRWAEIEGQLFSSDIVRHSSGREAIIVF